MAETTDARAAIEALQGHEAWAIIRRSTRAGDRDTVGLVGGRRHVVESILDIPLEEGPCADGHIADRLVAIPFRQVAERGFEAHDDGTPLVVVDIETELEFSVAEVVAAIDDTGVEFADRGGFETDDVEYGKLVESIIRDEIGQGEGANLVVGRHYRATVADWGADKALTVFRRLLERERGAYWTYVFFTGDRYLIGASPERHVSIHGGDVRMNPISGTFRIPARRRRVIPSGRAPRLPPRREGDLRALHGRRRGAQDDVRHLQRGRPGARAVPQADEPPRPHRVPPRRPHQPRPPRGPARHHVRRHGDGLAGRERLPADQAVRAGRPRLLRRRAGGPGPRRGRRSGRRQPDRDPHRRRRPVRQPHGDGRGHAGAGLGPGVRGRRDPRQGRRHPQRLRPGAAGARERRQHRRAGQRRGRAARPQRAQPPALVVLAHRPGRLAAGPAAGREERGDPRRRGRLREHAAPPARRARHDQHGRAPRGHPRGAGRLVRPASTW